MLFRKFNYLFNVCNASSLDAIVGGRYEIIDRNLVFAEERMDVLLIEDARSLGLRKDEVKEETEAEPGVEWNPRLDAH